MYFSASCTAWFHVNVLPLMKVNLSHLGTSMRNAITSPISSPNVHVVGAFPSPGITVLWVRRREERRRKEEEGRERRGTEGKGGSLQSSMRRLHTSA